MRQYWAKAQKRRMNLPLTCAKVVQIVVEALPVVPL
jgi:hypothetical protein